MTEINNSYIEIFQKKGVIKTLLILLANNSKIDSKYKMSQLLKLSNTTLKRNISILNQYKLIQKNEHLGPRSRTEINLTIKGKIIAQKLKEIIILTGKIGDQ